MHTQQEWLLSNLLEFYKNREYLEIVKKIINREFVIQKSKKLSIRIVNWFVTNYAKQHFTVYEIPEKIDTSCDSKIPTKRFFVWTSYKSTEDSFSKIFFDPYSRQERILIPYDNQNKIETTIGQLHFFKWAIINKVIDYIIEHYDEINQDMTVRLNTIKKRAALENNNDGDNGKTRKKREELSVSACRSIRKEFVPVKLSF
jgi:hypothetical protein